MKGILNPFIRYANWQDWGARGTQKHTPEDCRIFYVLFGEFEMYTARDRYFLKEGDFLYIPARTRYQLGPIAHPDTRFINLNFDLTEAQSVYTAPFEPILEEDEPYKRPFQQVLFSPFDREILLTNIPKFRAPLYDIVTKFQTKTKYYRDFSSGILKQILVELAIESEEQEGYSAPVVEAEKYIQLHYMESITNEDVAHAVGYHPYYLSRLMKRETGKTLRQALIDHRLQVAREMLLSTSYPVSQISTECGFTSSSHFAEAFRTAFLQTPKEYRVAKEQADAPKK